MIAVGLAAIPLALLLTHRSSAPATPVGRKDLRLSRIASELARRPVEVHCRPSGGKLLGPAGDSGSVGFDLEGRPDDFAELTSGVCSTLHAYARHAASGDFDVAWSMNALAHESYHLAGVRNEAVTECYALQGVPFVARSLGATADQAEALFWITAGRVRDAMPREYWTRDCYEGGPLDLRPSTPGLGR